ncbi:MAG: carboxypeptidase regulatory-like domain-containing protein [Acidobacteriota bacterium]|nr:carboxypeptidase regulatory-like domain-containing protein [Acidobacteriota bacterium]
MRGAKGNNPLWLAPVAGLMAVTLLPVSAMAGPAGIRFSGQLGGLVTDSGGRPQAGAVVMLLNRQDKVLQRAATDIGGTFAFADLLPDIYAVRVSLASFVPAIRDRVPVKPGMRSLLEVNLSRVFSTVQLLNSVPAPGGLMDDDWKWTLRSNAALRPILRMFPAVATLPGSTPASHPAMFSDSAGILRISASDGGQTIGDTGEADLGTQFAFATSLKGGSRVQVSGNLGYGATTGTPAAGLRTTFSREIGGTTPAVSFTMRQLYIPFRSGQTLGLAGGDNSMPTLRTMSLSYADKRELGDSLTAEYGFEMDNVSFLDRLHYLSPYARLNYAIGKGSLFVSWTSGNARPELGVSSDGRDADLQRDLTALSVLPRVTLENGATQVQRGDDYEIGVSQKIGSREYRVSAYDERISNTALMIANPDAGLGIFQGDLVPDLFSNSAIFNAGTFDAVGYMASVTQDLGEDYKISATFGSLGMLAARPNALIGSADDLRAALDSANRPAFTLRASGIVRRAGTRFMASYQWTNYRYAMPLPQYSTDEARPDPGLNFMVRQPIPGPPGVPWRIEASAEIRNLLAQGYLPVAVAGGQQLLLVNTPRTFRGGLAFVF